MRPFNLKEFAEDMRCKGDIRDADLADEILALIDIEEEVAEPYSDLCLDISFFVPKELETNPAKSVEWLADRSNLLTEIEKHLKEAGEDTGANGNAMPADDAVKGLLDTLAEAEAILEAAGWPGGNFIDALQGLADRAARAPEEVEIVSYDL